MPIYFYSTRAAYGGFSNFSAHGIEMDGRWYRTTEHYFQAQKFAGTAYAELVREARTPKQAAELGRDRTHPLRADWEQVKDDVMRDAVLQKFRTHPDLQRELLSTGDEQIIEATTNDYYWGCGTNGTGKNMLGVILMETRETLRARLAQEQPGAVA